MGKTLARRVDLENAPHVTLKGDVHRSAHPA
jgi:hypothetical protein